MSLINDALKKAQQQRQGDQKSERLTPPPPIPRTMPERSGPNALSFLMVFVAGGVLLALIGGGAWWIFQNLGSDPEPTRVVKPVVEEPSTEENQGARSTMGEVRETLDRGAQRAQDIDEITNNTDDERAEEDSQPPTEPRATPSTPSPPPPTSSDVERDPEVQTFLRNISITAREAGEDSRIIVDGQIFFIGDTVLIEHGLRFIAIRSSEVIFEDRRGAVYRRRL